MEIQLMKVTRVVLIFETGFSMSEEALRTSRQARHMLCAVYLSGWSSTSIKESVDVLVTSSV